MKRNNKELLHLTFRELNGLVNCLVETFYGDEEKKEENSEFFDAMMDRSVNLLDWLEENYDMYEESENWEKTQTRIAFEKEFDYLSECDVCKKIDPDYYMVKDEIWEKYGCGEGQMCFKCLKDKLGRDLVAGDFTDAPINEDNEFVKKLREVYKLN